MKVYVSTFMTIITFSLCSWTQIKASEVKDSLDFITLKNCNNAISTIRKLKDPNRENIEQLAINTRDGNAILCNLNLNSKTIKQVKPASLQELELARQFIINQALSIFSQRTGSVKLSINTNEDVGQNVRYIRHYSVICTWNILMLYLLDNQTKSYFLDETNYKFKIKKHASTLINKLHIADNTFKDQVLEQILAFKDSDFDYILGKNTSIVGTFKNTYLFLSNKKNKYKNVSANKKMKKIHQNYIIYAVEKTRLVRKNFPGYLHVTQYFIGENDFQYGRQKNTYNNEHPVAIFFANKLFHEYLHLAKNLDSFVAIKDIDDPEGSGFYLNNNDYVTFEKEVEKIIAQSQEDIKEAQKLLKSSTTGTNVKLGLTPPKATVQGSTSAANLPQNTAINSKVIEAVKIFKDWVNKYEINWKTIRDKKDYDNKVKDYISKIAFMLSDDIYSKLYSKEVQTSALEKIRSEFPTFESLNISSSGKALEGNINSGRQEQLISFLRQGVHYHDLVVNFKFTADEIIEANRVMVEIKERAQAANKNQRSGPSHLQHSNWGN